MKTKFYTPSLLLLGIVCILISDRSLFNPAISMNWDALDSIWPFLRWYGSALRQGYFPDFFPNIFSGFPIGAEILVGPYNIFYLFFAYLFPKSVLSLNFIYLSTEMAVFIVGYAIGRTYQFNSIVNLYLGLALVASGNIIGHASHFSHIQAALGLAGFYLSLRLALVDETHYSFSVALLSIYHLCTAGYIQDTVFGAQCLAPYFIWIFYKNPTKRKALIYCCIGALLGLMISSPAIWHFYSLFKASARFEGQELTTALRGSMPIYSILNFLWPTWKMQYTEPTMERFHLLFISTPLIAVALYSAIYKKINQKVTIILIISITLLIILSLGSNSPLPIRAWLAENFYIYRTGRYPSAEHRGIALFLLGLLSAFGFQQLLNRWGNFKYFLMLLVLIDFFIIKNGLEDMQYSTLRELKNISAPIFKASYNSEEQYLIDQPRNCTEDGGDNSIAIQIERNHLAPNNFYWWGYESMVNNRYAMERSKFQNIICGPSRLWNAESLLPQHYLLKQYTPGYINFTITGDKPDLVKLIWADVNDPFWQLKINGEKSTLVNGPANLRQFTAKSGDQVEMNYMGPYSQFWR